MISINPYTQEEITRYAAYSPTQVANLLTASQEAFTAWRTLRYADRGLYLLRIASLLRANSRQYAELITTEMGKRLIESLAEVEKCAWVCEHYAEHTEILLTDEIIYTEAMDSRVVFEPMGTVLAVMPWNFPFWQAFRCIAPALMAGNCVALKHASNVQGCAAAIGRLFADANLPDGVFTVLHITSNNVKLAIEHPAVIGVALTGSDAAGRAVAAVAGMNLKKAVLELGGSDPFIVLPDANIAEAAQTAVKSRMITSGQTCISAKRFIIDQAIADEFIEKVTKLVNALVMGDPMNETTTMAPLASAEFATQLHKQVTTSVAMGAVLVTGGDFGPTPTFYQPTILTNVYTGMPVFDEETFGPVMAITIVNGVEEAIKMANRTGFGLGASLWTADLVLARNIATRIEAGAVFVNGLVKSDPRLPFGGIKQSGLGRELASYGLKEFMNIKTVWIK